MNIKKLPFEPTSQIFRYLKTILKMEKEHFAKNTERIFLIERYILPKEEVSDESEINNNEFWNYLDNIGAIKYLTTTENNLAFVEFPYIKNSKPVAYPHKEEIKILDVKKIKKLFERIFSSAPIAKSVKELKKVTSMRLDERNHLLIINKGQNIMPFSSRRNKSGLEKETKQFRILAHLWEFRRETKKGKLIQEGSFESIGNIKISSQVKSEGATIRTISRLNEMFDKKELPVKIETRAGKSRLSVELS